MPVNAAHAILAHAALLALAAGFTQIPESEHLDLDPEARPVLLMQTQPLLAKAPGNAKGFPQQAVALGAAADIAETRATQAAGQRAARAAERSVAVDAVGEASQPLESIPVQQADAPAPKPAEETNNSSLEQLADVQTNVSGPQEANRSESEDLATVQTNASLPQESSGAADPDLPPLLHLLQNLMPRELRRMDREGHLVLPYAAVMGFGVGALLWMLVLVHAASVKPDQKAELQKYKPQLDTAFKALPVFTVAAAKPS